MLKLYMEMKTKRSLPPERIRAPSYRGAAIGPISELYQLKTFVAVESGLKGDPVKTHVEECKENSLLSLLRMKKEKKLSKKRLKERKVLNPNVCEPTSPPICQGASLGTCSGISTSSVYNVSSEAKKHAWTAAALITGPDSPDRKAARSGLQ
jgi:hypothetical protein